MLISFMHAGISSLKTKHVAALLNKVVKGNKHVRQNILEPSGEMSQSVNSLIYL